MSRASAPAAGGRRRGGAGASGAEPTSLTERAYARLEELIAYVAEEVGYDGPIDFSTPWRRLKLVDAIRDATGVDVMEHREDLAAAAKGKGIELDPGATWAKQVDDLLSKHVEPKLEQPTFVMDYPLDTSPLTRAHRSQPGLAEKWDLYIGGVERATAYSELVDPVAQRERFTAQAAMAAAGDPEAMVVDEDFLEALEYGMPPTGGMGMGMDRLMMTLTGLGIRETILFPLVRPITN